MANTVLVLGARNLGGAIIDHFLRSGWSAAAVARSEETLERVRSRGALALAADASDPGMLADALATTRRELGSLDAVVNAVTASRPPSSGPFGGGELATADLAAFNGWTVAVAEQAFVFLSTAAQALRQSGGGALIQDHRWFSPARDAGQGAVGCRRVRHPGARASRSTGAPRRGYPRRAAGCRRDDPVAQDRRLHARATI
ncbi:MAG: SDR family NAD(P)-dependent oxidoreductase [Solirubrobacterales bacterium]|nr:SDR family NAD(P)-dependent oxidoreductase [Solirubrobacterales bacterium]